MSAALREIRRIYPTAHITLMICEESRNVAEHCPYVDEILINIHPFAFNNYPLVYDRNATMSAELLRRRYDIAFAFAHYPSSLLLAYMSGARICVAHAFSAQNEAFEIGELSAFLPLLTIQAPKWIYGTHSVEHGLALISGVTQIPITNRETEVWYTPFDYTIAERFLREHVDTNKRLYGLCMGGVGYRKKWSPEKYAKLVEMIVEEEPDVDFLIFGGGKIDEESAADFKQHLDENVLRDHIFDLTGESTYRVSAVLLSFCDMYIGNDTGTMHLAATVKTPVLTPSCFAADADIRYNVLNIYYPYHVPSVTVLVKHALPECINPSHGVGCIVDDHPHCIAQIEPETMFAAYKMLKVRIEQKIIEPLFVS